jgi:predicted O-linked N-acetylglucosamine transferase (SPINDLY family)
MNLGAAYAELGEMTKAVNRYKDVLEQSPESVNGLRNLGFALEKQGDIDGAIESFSKVLELEPENELLRLHVETICPPVMPSNLELDSYRFRLRETLNALSDTDLKFNESAKLEIQFPFLVAYHGGNDLSIKKQWSSLFAKHFERRQTTEFEPYNPSRPIRIGFVVTHSHEGVFLKCMRGIINRLPDLGDFEISIICSQQGGVDILSKGITHSAIRFLPIQSDLEIAAETIHAEKFDILHFWEVGTDSLNYFLPFYRLAAVQCACWGWPTTTGIPQMDYFITSELLETDQSDEYYSEKLVRFEHLPTYYHFPPLPESPKSRAVFGLGARDNIYLCTQNLRKVHPDMDRLIEGILEGDPQGRVLFIQDAQPGVTDLLRKRFLREIPGVANRIQFLPRRKEEAYLNIVQLADVILDTLHYCGGANTTYDAFSAGTPIVTLPMRYHRGRYTSAAYRQIGVVDLIANSAKDYVDIALKLGTDPEYREKKSKMIRESIAVLFEDEKAVEELADFFKQVVTENK